MNQQEQQLQEPQAQTLILHAEPPPLAVDATGTVRVGRSRVTLDVVLHAYESGMEPEAIARAYDTLEIADVFGAIAYYLRHRAEVQAYLRRREAEAARLRSLVEANQPPGPTKEELLARRAQREKDHAAPGQ
jgi:uncharacterized protein (DUF433 family)